MDTLANEPAKCYGGVDADGNPIFRKRTISRRSGATLNRYLVALGALFTWAKRLLVRVVAPRAPRPPHHE